MIDRIYRMHIIQDCSQHLRLLQRATSYVGRVLHASVNEITVTGNLIQGSIRDFSISIVKSIRQNKTNIVVCREKQKKTRKTIGTQLTKSDMQWKKRRT